MFFFSQEQEDVPVIESDNPIQYISADGGDFYTEEVANVQITNEQLMELNNGNFQDGAAVHYIEQQDKDGQIHLIPVSITLVEDGTEPVAMTISQP